MVHSLTPSPNGTLLVASWSSLDDGGCWSCCTTRPTLGDYRVRPSPPATIRLVPPSTTPSSPVEVRPRPSPSPSTARPPARSPPPAPRVGTDAAAPLTELRWPRSTPARSSPSAGRPERHGRRRRPRAGALEERSTSATRASRLTTEVRDGALVATPLRARRVALFVTLEADRPGRFSTNAVALFPGHPAEIGFTPPPATPPPSPSPRATSIRATLNRGTRPMTDFSYQLYSSRNFPPLTDTLKHARRAPATRRRGLRRALRRRRPRSPS